MVLAEKAEKERGAEGASRERVEDADEEDGEEEEEEGGEEGGGRRPR